MSPTKRRILGFVLLIGLAIAVAASSRLHGAAEQAVDWVGAVIRRHPMWGGFAFVGLSALSAMLAFFSSVVLVPVAVREFGEPLTMLLLWTGWLLGGATAYAVGRLFGRRVVRLLVSAARVQRYEDRITARARFPVILLFQAAVPSEIPGYVLGIVRYPFLTYLAALALAELPFALGGVFLGAGFLNRQYGLMIALGLAGIVFLTWAVSRLRREIGEP